FLLFFFFQAEDGIRDFHVTGVQTCALPIFRNCSTAARYSPGFSSSPVSYTAHCSLPGWPRCSWARRLSGGITPSCGSTPSWPIRSEERRVGKECTSRRATDH